VARSPHPGGKGLFDFSADHGAQEGQESLTECDLKDIATVGPATVKARLVVGDPRAPRTGSVTVSGDHPGLQLAADQRPWPRASWEGFPELTMHRSNRLLAIGVNRSVAFRSKVGKRFQPG
jgi:hypothetical protein